MKNRESAQCGGEGQWRAFRGRGYPFDDAPGAEHGDQLESGKRMAGRKQRRTAQRRSIPAAQSQQDAAQKEQMVERLGGKDEVAPEIEKPKPCEWIEVEHVGEGRLGAHETVNQASKRDDPAAPEEAQEPKYGSKAVQSDDLFVEGDDHAGAAEREDEPRGHVQYSRVAPGEFPRKAERQGQRLNIETWRRRVGAERQAIGQGEMA